MESTQTQPEILYNTAIYARLSIEDNGVQGDSIENQVYMIEKFISNCSDLKLIHTFVDNGETCLLYTSDAADD